MYNTDNIKYFCSFIGWGRSGHSMVGGLLNSHPNIYIKNEYFIFTGKRKKYTQKQICKEIIKKVLERKKQKWGGFDHEVFKMDKGDPLVVGPKKGGKTSNVAYNKPKLFNKIYKEKITIPQKWIHIQRNPYDNISRIFIKGNQRSKFGKKWQSLDQVIDIYFNSAESVRKVIDEFDCITIKQEDLIYNVKENVKKLCNFLDVNIIESHLDHCKSVVWSKPRKSRNELTNLWNDKRIQDVQNHMEQYDFMKGYQW